MHSARAAGHTEMYSSTADFQGYDEHVFFEFDDFEDFDLVGNGDLPGYVVVAFYRIVGGRRVWLRSYLYGPSGYMGDFATPAEALQVARAHRDNQNFSFR